MKIQTPLSKLQTSKFYLNLGLQLKENSLNIRIQKRTIFKTIYRTQYRFAKRTRKRR